VSRYTDTKLERAVLAAVLQDGDNTRAASVVARLSEVDFTDPFALRAYRGLARLAAEGRPLDLHLLAEVLRADPLGAKVEGSLGVLAAEDVLPWHSGAYADRLRELAQRRALASLRIDEVLEGTQTAAEAVASIRAQLEAIDARGAATEAFGGLEIARDAHERLREGHEDTPCRSRGLPTGLLKVDGCLRGMRPGGLYVAAARPGQGKTALAINIAMRCALRERGPVVFYSYEMSRAELGDRIAASEARVSLEDLVAGRLATKEIERVTATLARLGDAPFHLVDQDLRLEQMGSLALRLHARAPLALVVVDYLQLVKTAVRRDSREQEVAEVARGLKRLARSVGAPVLALAQLNRELERREDKRPRLADLRESGDIEAAADAVLAIHRPHYYDESADPQLAEILVLKHRHGRIGIATVRWTGEHVRFDD